MELNSFKFHAKANYNSLSADLEKIKSSDVFDDVATLVLKVGSLNKVVNGNQQDIEQIESDIKQLEISNKRETRYISRLESQGSTTQSWPVSGNDLPDNILRQKTWTVRSADPCWK